VDLKDPVWRWLGAEVIAITNEPDHGRLLTFHFLDWSSKYDMEIGDDQCFGKVAAFGSHSTGQVKRMKNLEVSNEVQVFGEGKWCPGIVKKLHWAIKSNESHEKVIVSPQVQVSFVLYESCKDQVRWFDRRDPNQIVPEKLYPLPSFSERCAKMNYVRKFAKEDTIPHLLQLEPNMIISNGNVQFPINRELLISVSSVFKDVLEGDHTNTCLALSDLSTPTLRFLHQFITSARVPLARMDKSVDLCLLIKKYDVKDMEDWAIGCIRIFSFQTAEDFYELQQKTIEMNLSDLLLIAEGERIGYISKHAHEIEDLHKYNVDIVTKALDKSYMTRKRKKRKEETNRSLLKAFLLYAKANPSELMISRLRDQRWDGMQRQLLLDLFLAS